MGANLRWPAASAENPQLALRSGCVDCWAVSLADVPTEAAAAFGELLSADEIARAARFHLENDRANYAARHAALRLIIARYLAAAPSSLAFVDEAHGRPVLAGHHGLYFSLSDSGELALVAVATIATVGIDVERMRELRDPADIARGHFALAECDDLLRLPPEKQLAAFFTTWARKEAYIKAIGLGLSFPLASFTTGVTGQVPVLHVNGRHADDWTMADLDPADGYKAALAVSHPQVSIRCRHADWAWLMRPGPGSER
jgi:4'-phosphopantetheinyl transferase